MDVLTRSDVSREGDSYFENPVGKVRSSPPFDLTLAGGILRPGGPWYQPGPHGDNRSQILDFQYILFKYRLDAFISAWFAFLLPCFSTYKALARKDNAEIERLSIYWTIIGALVGFEYILEWTVSWFPFYWEVKTLILLFLALPQTQGSTWVYKSYVEPFFIQNEANLDAGIVSAQQNVLAFVTSRLSALWDILWSVLNKTPANAQGAAPNGAPGPSSAQSPLETAKQLFSSYAPGVLGALARPPAQPHSSSSSFQPPVAGNVYQRSSPATTPGTTPGYKLSVDPPFPEPHLHQ